MATLFNGNLGQEGLMWNYPELQVPGEVRGLSTFFQCSEWLISQVPRVGIMIFSDPPFVCQQLDTCLSSSVSFTLIRRVQCSSVAQSCPTLCDPVNRSTPGLRAHQPTPGVHSNSCPSSQWCHPAISSSVVPFSSCPQSLPASGSFPVSQLFTWGGQSIGVSALASFLPKKSQGWSPSEWTGWTSLQSKGLSTPHHQLWCWSSPAPQFKIINSSVLSFLHSPPLTSIHNHRKNHSLD